MRLRKPSAASVPCTRFPREMAERRRVMRKCVFGFRSSEVVVGGAEAGEDEEARRAATVREAAVPL